MSKAVTYALPATKWRARVRPVGSGRLPLGVLVRLEQGVLYRGPRPLRWWWARNLDAALLRAHAAVRKGIS